MLESAVSSHTAALEFYTHLQQFDLNDSTVRSALAFARTCRELLLRVASAWRCQRGILAADSLPLPGLQALFDLKLASVAATASADCRDSIDFTAVAAWFSQVYRSQEPLSGSYQVWVGNPGESTIRLCGPAAEGCPAPLKIDPSLGLELAQRLAQREVAAIGHYDVHGIAMLALTLRTLRAHGADDCRGILSFEKTGDIGKLWKRTVPQAIREVGEQGAVVMIDCPVHSRTPEHTLKALATLDQVPGCELVIIDHHGDTLELAPQLVRPSVQLVLTDVLGCGLVIPDGGDVKQRELQVLGAIADKVPEVTQAIDSALAEALGAANDAYNRMLLHFSPTPADFKATNKLPAEPLWEALAADSPVVAATSSLVCQLPEVDALPEPNFLRCGAMLFVTAKLTVLGRSWYGLLEQLMERHGASYAVALRVLDGKRANLLLLTHWSHTHAPPVRRYIPPEYWSRCLGHDAAVWVDLDKSQALNFLEQVAANANHYAGLECNFQAVRDAVRVNILESPGSELVATALTAQPVQD